MEKLAEDMAAVEAEGGPEAVMGCLRTALDAYRDARRQWRLERQAEGQEGGPPAP